MAVTRPRGVSSMLGTIPLIQSRQTIPYAPLGRCCSHHTHVPRSTLSPAPCPSTLSPSVRPFIHNFPVLASQHPHLSPQPFSHIHTSTSLPLGNCGPPFPTSLVPCPGVPSPSNRVPLQAGTSWPYCAAPAPIAPPPLCLPYKGTGKISLHLSWTQARTQG